MAVSTVTNRVAYQGDGTSAVFAFAFELQAQLDLAVFTYNSSSTTPGLILPQVLNTDYSFSGSIDPSGIYPNGGNIIFNSTPNAQTQVVLFRSSVVTNDFFMSQNGTVPSSSLNNTLDRLTLIAQRLQDLGTRSVRLADGYPRPFDPSLPANIAQAAGKRLIVNSTASGWTFDETIGNYIRNTLIIADTNSSLVSLGGSVAGKILVSNGSSAPSWGDVVFGSTALSGVVQQINGGTGTGTSSFTQGQVIFGGALATFTESPDFVFDDLTKRLTLGGEIRVSSSLVANLPLIVNGSGVIQTTDLLPTSVGGTGTNTNYTQHGVIYASSATQFGTVPSAAAGLVLTSNGSSAPSYQTVAVTPIAPRSVTTTDLATTADDMLLLSGSSFTQTIYTAVGNAGRRLRLVHNGTNLSQLYTLDTTGGQTIGGIASGSYALYTNGEVLEIESDGANWQIKNHFAQTDWIDAGVITISATGGGVVKGTTTRDKFLWKRSSNQIFWRYEFVQTVAGTAGTAAYLFTVPTGLTMASTILTTSSSITTTVATVIGYGKVANTADGAGSQMKDAQAIPYSTTQFYIAALNTVASADGFTQRIVGGSATGLVVNAFALSNTNAVYLFTGSYPVSGWQP